jgi:hypothetical protein
MFKAAVVELFWFARKSRDNKGNAYDDEAQERQNRMPPKPRPLDLAA